SWNAPQTLGQGMHHVEIDAYDLAGNKGSAAVDVKYGSVCTKNSDCMDPKDVCTGGHCVPGPGSPGGLGAVCTSNTDCQSNDCGDDGTHKYCVSSCDPMDSNSCPAGFGCLTDAKVCWPGANGGGG